MSRLYWTGVLIFSLLLSGGSAYYLTSALREKKTVEVPLKETDNKISENDQDPLPEAEKSPDGSSPPDPSEIPVERNILFNYYSSTAKKVFIVGDFNQWFREPLKKKTRNKWEISRKILPGTYEYMYVVNNKRVLDPNNKKRSKTGKSILTIKPVSKK